MIESVIKNGTTVTTCAEWIVGVSGEWIRWLMMIEGRRWGQVVVEERVLGFWMGKQEFVEVKGIEPEE
jgi:hypothetical protein